jgi:hypothetical protein
MTPADAAEILGTAAAFDRRTVGKADAHAWADALAGVRFEDAIAAVKHHYATSREFIYPSDVLAIVKAIRAERVRAAGDLSDRIPLHIANMPDGDEHTRASLSWLQETARRIGNGENVDDIAPRLQLVPADPQAIEAIAEKLAREKRAPGTRPREKGETA